VLPAELASTRRTSRPWFLPSLLVSALDEALIYRRLTERPQGSFQNTGPGETAYALVPNVSFFHDADGTDQTLVESGEVAGRTSGGLRRRGFRARLRAEALGHRREGEAAPEEHGSSRPPAPLSQYRHCAATQGSFRNTGPVQRPVTAAVSGVALPDGPSFFFGQVGPIDPFDYCPVATYRAALHPAKDAEVDHGRMLER
jgi:hypothetical protein